MTLQTIYEIICDVCGKRKEIPCFDISFTNGGARYILKYPSGWTHHIDGIHCCGNEMCKKELTFYLKKEIIRDRLVK